MTKFVRIEHEGRPIWAIAEGEALYHVQGDIYASPAKGHLIGPVGGTKVLSPVPGENQVIVLLDNWSSRDGREGPGFLIKSRSARINPGEAIIYPNLAKQVWIETEIAIVIGKTCKNVSAEAAEGHILGYTVSNDVTASEWTTETSFPVLTGKGFDTFCILGPCIDTELDPLDAKLRGYINGEQYFEKSTRHMLWNVFEVIAWVSRIMTLSPGDVISCGACAETLTRVMQPGDVVGVAIDGIGKFENNVRAE